MSRLILPSASIAGSRSRRPLSQSTVVGPSLGDTFHIQYTGTMDWNRNVDAYNVDAFNTSEQQVTDLKARGVYPIAYMSLGTAEDWRSDFGDFLQPGTFESGDTSGWEANAQPIMLSGPYGNWTVDTTNPRTGAYSARSNAAWNGFMWLQGALLSNRAIPVSVGDSVSMSYYAAGVGSGATVNGGFLWLDENGNPIGDFSTSRSGHSSASLTDGVYSLQGHTATVPSGTYYVKVFVNPPQNTNTEFVRVDDLSVAINGLGVGLGDFGYKMTDWDGEFYVDVTSQSVRDVMAARLDMIASKGFLGVDPDNVDGYYANTGFPANETVTAYRDYLLWFAGECAARGLACGLKNGQDMLNATLLDATYFHVVESCVLYTECDASSGFIDAGKPVFNIEYASEHTEPYTFLDDLSALGHQAVVKTYDLDAFSVNSWDEPSGGGEPAEGEQTVAFTADETTDFINPERGWMLRGPDTAFSGARSGDSDVPFGYAVMWTDTFGTPWNGNAGENPFRLDNYRNANLPQSLLDELDAWFTEARTRGIKLKIRFMYNYNNSDQDAPLSRMQTHIGQLAPVLNANRDVIAVMDAGFAGQYGEWSWDGSGSSYTTANFVSELPGGTGNLYFWTEPWLTAFADLTETLLTELHDDIYIGLRYPRHDNGYRLVFNGSGAWRTDWSTHDHEANRFDGSDISRVGLYMDCLWSNQSHVGTFNYDGGQQASDIAAAEAAGTIAPISGETCIVGGLNTYNDCSQVLGAGDADAVTLGIDMLYRKFWTGIYDKWISDGCYDQISRRLGYRIHLNSATLPASVGAGGSMTVTLNLTNTGFGKVFHARPLDLVFVGPGGPFTARMTSDARLDLPLAGETVESSFTFTAPAGLQSGQSYAVHLRLPDPDPLGNGLDDDVRYCIRLANTGIWDGTNGRHDLGMSITAL